MSAGDVWPSRTLEVNERVTLHERRYLILDREVPIGDVVDVLEEQGIDFVKVSTVDSATGLATKIEAL